MRKTIAAAFVAVTLTIVGSSSAGAAVPQRTPKACLRALDHAETVIDYAVQGFNLAAEGFDAASRFDVDGINAVADEMNGLIPEVTAARVDYDVAAAKCRARS